MYSFYKTCLLAAASSILRSQRLVIASLSLVLDCISCLLIQLTSCTGLWPRSNGLHHISFRLCWWTCTSCCSLDKITSECISQNEPTQVNVTVSVLLIALGDLLLLGHLDQTFSFITAGGAHKQPWLLEGNNSFLLKTLGMSYLLRFQISWFLSF